MVKLWMSIWTPIWTPMWASIRTSICMSCTSTWGSIWMSRWMLPCHQYGCLYRCNGMPWHAVACHGMPCHGMACHAIACHCMPCHAMACHSMPCHATWKKPYLFYISLCGIKSVRLGLGVFSVLHRDPASHVTSGMLLTRLWL